MIKNRQNLSILIANIVLGIAMTILMTVFLNTIEWYLKLLGYGAICVFTIFSVLFYFLNKKALFRSFFVFNIVTLVFILTFVTLNIFGLFDSLKDLEKVKALIQSWGAYGYIIFILLQLFQVIILPAPGFIFYLAGTAIYGPVVAFLISYISVVVGSVISFLIGRYAGKPVVYWCVGKENTDKYLNILGKKGNMLFILMQLLPFFPDDILCMVVGLTPMKLKFFVLVMIFVRPIYIAAVCFLGTGKLIPFSGWGIPCWIAIFLICMALFILYSKYQDKIENWFKSVSDKNSSKN